MTAPCQYPPRANFWILATWTGANAGASWTMTRLPEARSITSKSAAGISAHSVGFEAAMTSVGVLGLAGGAAATRAISARAANRRMLGLSGYDGSEHCRLPFAAQAG